MTLREWLDVYTHNGDTQLVCAWRKRAWRAMRPVVERFVKARDGGSGISVGAMLRELDAAAEAARIGTSGKRWRKEHRTLLEICRSQRELWPEPTLDEAGACEVAIDLVEVGDHAKARTLLDEQAPNRLNRPCPACKAKPGSQCIDIDIVGAVQDLGYSTLAPKKVSIERIVPHMARVQP